MGVPEFLSKVLDSAGRTIDLRDFAERGVVRSGNKRRRRPLRIGIDVSSWVYKAAHGFGDMLGDERHLTNYGRASLHQQQQLPDENDNPISEEKIQEYVQSCTKYVLTRLETLRQTSQAELLVVLDGKTPPVKGQEVQRRRRIREEHVQQRDEPVDPLESPTTTNERRTRAFKRAGAGKHFSRIITELMNGLTQAQASFLVAPYEADSELAYLSYHNYIDLIITEDSDLVAHGARAIVYKSVGEIGNGKPRGILLQFSDIGSVEGKLRFLDFSPVMMAVLFVAVGCDYCDKLKGIGLLTACRIIRQAFLEPLSTGSALSQVFAQLYKNSYTSNYSQDFKQDYEVRFMAALVMYRHPIVYDPIKRQCVIAGAINGRLGDADLMDHEPYIRLCDDMELVQQIVGELPDPDSYTAKAEGRARIRRLSEEEDNDSSEDDHLPQSQEFALETQDNEVPQNRTVDHLNNGHAPQNNGLKQGSATLVDANLKKLSNGLRLSQDSLQAVDGSSTKKLISNGPLTQESIQAIDGSQTSANDTSMSVRSPNLLYSSTPEKTHASQRTLSSTKSPNLLYSSTPEEKTQGERSTGSATKSPNLLDTSAPKYAEEVSERMDFYSYDV